MTVHGEAIELPDDDQLSGIPLSCTDPSSYTLDGVVSNRSIPKLRGTVYNPDIRVYE